MDLNKRLKELKPQHLNCNVFDVYSYNGLTMQDLLCQFFTKINECVTSTNEVLDLTEWLVSVGLEEEVVKKLMMLIEDGTVEKLINVNLFNTLNEKINGLSSQLEQNMNKVNEQFNTKASQKDLEVVESQVKLLTKVESGQTEGNTELLDIRIAENGTTYDTAGDSVRKQFSEKINKIQVENEIRNSKIQDLTYWSKLVSTTELSGTEMIVNTTGMYGQVYQLLNKNIFNNNDVIYYCVNLSASNPNISVDLRPADSNKSFLKKLHSGSGSYERISNLGTVSDADGIRLRIMSNVADVLQIKVKEVVVINLTRCFGKGNEPTSLTEFENSLVSENSNYYFEDKACVNYANVIISNYNVNKIKDNVIESIELSRKPIYVKIADNTIKYNFKYNQTEDMCIQMNKKGVNNIFDFSNIYKIANSEAETSNKLELANQFYTNSTDWLGPYTVKAINNINGDNTESHFFTGGNHGYNNFGDISGNTATGRTSEITFFVEGRKVTNFEGYVEYIDIYWTNYIQAYNTTKSNGGGREVLKENYHLHFNGNKIEIDNTIEALEDVLIEKYYGIQCQRTNWNEKLYYHSSKNKKWNDGTIASNSQSTTCDLITHKKSNDYLDIYFSSIGVGNKEFISDLTYNAMASDTKTYFYNLKNANLLTGDVISYKGHYRFYSK